MSGFSLILAILSLITALVPLADHSLQFVEHRRQTQSKPVTVVAHKPVAPVEPPTPPEAGQPNVFLVDGVWWKKEGDRWLVWTNQPQQVAQGGVHHVVR